MLKTKSGLSEFNQKLNKYLLNPISGNADVEKDNVKENTVTEIKNVKFSYPKNGLYGLL